MTIMLPEDTPALTVRNPWAYAITHLGKNIENRTWSAPQAVDRFLIHAGKAYDSEAPREFVDRARGVHAASSAIVGVATLAYCCDTTVRDQNGICGCGSWAIAGQHHWVLWDVVRLAEPIPCNGRLGMWRPPAQVLAAVEQQLQAVRAVSVDA